MSKLAKQPTAPLHVLRSSLAGNNARKRPAKATPSTQYPPGYFTALCVRDGWPYKGWQPSQRSEAEIAAQARSERSRISAQQGVDSGRLTCVNLPGTPDTAAELVKKLRNWRP
jgi:hypothetical protein